MLRIFARAIVLQLLAWFLVALWLQFTGRALPPSGAITAICVLAAMAAWFFHADRWWVLIHAVFPWAVYAALQIQISPLWYLVAFLFLLLVYYPVARSRVPLYLTHATAFEIIEEKIRAEAKGRSSIQVMDFGSGTGGLLVRLARAMPKHIFVGVEAAPIPWLISRWRSKGLANLSFRRGDFWREDLSQCQVVYAFLSPEPMPRLWQKVSQEMAQGTLLISNTFAVPNQKPEATIELPGSVANRLYLYRVGQRR
jgi:hypothetical protein